MKKRQDDRLAHWPILRPEVTGVGSLPFRSRAEADSFVRTSCPVAPFLPELPFARGGAFMTAAALAPPDSHALALRAARVIGAPARLVKLQICGPATLSRVAKVSAARAAEQIDRWIDAFLRIETRGRPRLIVLDEPALAASRSRSALSRCLRRIRDGGAFSGIHCCGEFSPDSIAGIDPDVLSFDASIALDVVADSPAFARWYARGRVVALGSVPTRPARLSVENLARKAASALGRAGHREGVSPAPLVTGTCGFALSTEAWTKRAFSLLDRLATRLEKELSRCSSTART